MPILLEDRLRGYEDTAALACTGLADRITTRGMSTHSPLDGSTWLDISFVSSESNGNPLQGEIAVVDMMLTVIVRDLQRGRHIAAWVGEIARVRIYQTAPLAHGVLANTESLRRTSQVTELEGTPVVFHQTVVRAGNIKNTFDVDTSIGINTQTDADSSTAANTGQGHALANTAAKIVTWIKPGMHVGATTPDLMYAGVETGERILILDALGVIVDTIALTTTPTGAISGTVPLSAGSYTAQIVPASPDVTTLATTNRTVEVTEKPTS